ncbi:MAG: 4-alpha-glucanotransferase [Halioglobus sp.]|nr:4-alpha-glucanotransferase [Halioglobus sp.]
MAHRRAGVLLHPSSLPGPAYSGCLGAEARRFIDLIADAGLQIWQFLPLGPTHPDRCPYQLISVHAGNPDLIDLQWLAQKNWLSQREVDAGQASPEAKRRALDLASGAFFGQLHGTSDTAARYARFLEETAYWLEDYVRFQAFRDDLDRTPWTNWPAGLNRCEAGACDARAHELEAQLAALRFRQFVFHCQWHELRHYAHQRGILLFGDIPIYVHLESADVWAHQSLFNLDSDGHPVTVTGVPPDYFSEDGQLWGNPQYNWALMERTGFDWWLQRFASAARQFDIARIDHFRGLQAYWEIPAGATSAREGKWVAAPGRALLQAVREQYPELCLVAENLGIIGPEVEALRHEFDLPGMLILQFAFDGHPDNPYLPHRHAAGDIVYTGTHDNDTTLGWFEKLDAGLQERVYQCFDNPSEAMPWMLIHQAMASRANTAIVPWQDFLGLDGEHRMNTPGTLAGNWLWRFSWDQVAADISARIHGLVAATDRLPVTAGGGQPEYG